MSALSLKRNSKIILILAFVALCWGCADSFVPVILELEESQEIDFKAYREVYFADLIVSETVAKQDVEPHIRYLFTAELKSRINRPIPHLPLPGWRETGAKSPELNAAVLEQAECFSTLATSHPSALIITGQATLDMKTRSVIREVKEDGVKKNTFANVLYAEAGLKLFLYDTTKKKVIKEYPLTQKDSFSQPFAEDRAARSVFDTLIYRFIQRLTVQSRPKERALLLK